MTDRFAELQTEMSSGGAEAAFARLADQLRSEERYHDLFDALLMQARFRLGLPVIASTNLEELPEPLRTQAEEAYLAACKEAGHLLLAAKKYREAWMYLRPVGDKPAMAAALQAADANDESLEEIIEIALHEGVAPGRGFELVLKHYGTCNAITTFEGAIPHQTMPAQVQAAEMLVRHLYQELLANVTSHIEDERGAKPQGTTLGEVVREHASIFDNDCYHIDTSHLAATVRFARLISSPDLVAKALDLTEYGRRLSKQFQYAGEPPFEDLYPSHGLLFAATLGQQVDEATAYFREQAEKCDVHQEGTAAIETYIILLSRIGRNAEAMEAIASMVPTGAQLSHYAPKMYELAKKANQIDRYLEICRGRNDVLAFAAGLVQA